jgi:hypothetical protein
VNQWPFILAAYALAIAATAGLMAASARRMRRAERAADRLSDRR